MADRNPVFGTLRFPFSGSNGAAYLANTRTSFSGRDIISGLVDAFSSPGQFPAQGFISQVLGTDDPQVGQQLQSGAQSGGAFYDCTTGKCSDGRDLGFARWLDRWQVCTFGTPKAGPERDKLLQDICSNAPAMTKQDGTTGPSALGVDIFGKSVDTQLLKRLAFVLLAVVLIYAAANSLLRGGN